MKIKMNFYGFLSMILLSNIGYYVSDIYGTPYLQNVGVYGLWDVVVFFLAFFGIYILGSKSKITVKCNWF